MHDDDLDSSDMMLTPSLTNIGQCQCPWLKHTDKHTGRDIYDALLLGPSEPEKRNVSGQIIRLGRRMTMLQNSM